jgi:hypothetical protein
MYSGKHREREEWSRRRFLLTAGSVAALAGAEVNGLAAATKRVVCLVIDPADTVASSPVSLWAAEPVSRRCRPGVAVSKRCSDKGGRGCRGSPRKSGSISRGGRQPEGDADLWPRSASNCVRAAGPCRSGEE